LQDVDLAGSQRVCNASRMERVAALRIEVNNFKEWAASLSNGRALYGEWETEYPHWATLYSAANDLLRSGPSEWDSEARNLLLYTIARDNESELLAESLSESQVDALASAVLESDEPDAKWQVAEQIGKYPMTRARKTILFALALDENEYVRRRVMNLLAASSDKTFS
jgi:hypothetical protein